MKDKKLQLTLDNTYYIWSLLLAFGIACTAEHYFRIDHAQEHLHYICDIAVDELYILDHEAATMPQTPDQQRSFAAYSQRQAQNERRSMEQGGTTTGMNLPYVYKRMFCHYYYRKKPIQI